jgi:hypothetical protein
LHFDEIVPDLCDVAAEQHLTRVRACAQRHFPPLPLATGSAQVKRLTRERLPVPVAGGRERR